MLNSLTLSTEYPPSDYFIRFYVTGKPPAFEVEALVVQKEGGLECDKLDFIATGPFSTRAEASSSVAHYSAGMGFECEDAGEPPKWM